MARRNEAAEWLESPEGQRWSRGRHNEPARGHHETHGIGAFGELKADADAEPMSTGQAFRDRARLDAEFGRDR